MSARRLCIPELDPELGLQSLVELVRLEQDWVPSSVGDRALHPATVIASEAFLGVRPAKQYLYFVILSPRRRVLQGRHEPGQDPRRGQVRPRAAEGGTGGAKTGGNYAASLLAAEEAHASGFTQVLWLGRRAARSTSTKWAR